MAPTIEVAKGDRDAGRVDEESYEYPVALSADTPNILGLFSRFTIKGSGLVRLTSDQKYAITTNQAVMFYFKNAADEATALGVALESTTYMLANEHNYALLQKSDNAQWEEHTVNQNTLTVPAGFEGWIRVPHSSFEALEETHDFQRIRLTFTEDAIDNTYYAGAMCIVEEANCNALSVNGSPKVSLFPNKTIQLPDGVSTALNTYYGCETYLQYQDRLNPGMKVTVEDITAYKGCKLYYRYTNADGKEVKQLLLREGSEYYKTADTYDLGANSRIYYIPDLGGAENAAIIAETAAADTLADNVSVLGVSATYYADEEDNVTAIDQDGYFKLRFSARVVREVAVENKAYHLKRVKLMVAPENSNTFSTYTINSLTDRCDKYVDFVKVLRGKDTTKRYDIKAVGIYEAADGTQLDPIYSAVLTGKSFEFAVANDGILTLE